MCIKIFDSLRGVIVYYGNIPYEAIKNYNEYCRIVEGTEYIEITLNGKDIDIHGLISCDMLSTKNDNVGPYRYTAMLFKRCDLHLKENRIRYMRKRDVKYVRNY